MEAQEYRGTTPAGAGHVLTMAFAFWSSRLLLCADELGVFTALAAEPVALEALARRLRVQAEGLGDLLAALVNAGLLEHHEGVYRTSHDTALYLNREAPGYVGAWLAMARAAMADQTDIAAAIRGKDATPSEPARLLDRMWEDIGDILRETTLKDGC